MPFALGFWATVKSALTWSRPTYTPNAGGSDVAYVPLTNGSWFITKNDGSTTTTAYYYSTDGLSWSTGTMPNTRLWDKYSISSGKLVAWSATSTGGLAYTTNGTTWTAGNNANSAPVHWALFDGNYHLIGFQLGTAAKGLVWAADATLATQTTVDLSFNHSSIAWNGTSNGKYMMTRVAGSSSSIIKYCNGNPTTVGNWVSQTLPSAQSWTSVVYGSGTWVVFGLTTTYAYSTNDGTTWTSGTLPAAPNAPATLEFANVHRAYYVRGKFIYNAGANTGLYSSVDGINWVAEYTGTNSSLADIQGWASNSTTIVAKGIGTTGNYMLGQG